MSTLDIRKSEHGEITEIQFDESSDRIGEHSVGLLFIDENDDSEYLVCEWKDFDNFIAACHKARELWGPKA